MLIDFNKENAVDLPNFKGGEKSMAAKMHFDGTNRILHGTLVKGASIGMHKHESNSEIIYVISGKGKMLIDGETEYLEQGMCHYCPKGHTHSLMNENDEDLVFFAVIPEQ